MRYVLLITNETVINIYYIHYHLHIIHKKNQTIWTPRFLRGNPVTGEKTTEASLTSEFTSLGLKTWLGQQPLRIYLWRTKIPLIQFYFPAPTERGTNPYKPTE